jgi:transcriptional regulator with XRE-family HTH domain
MTQKRVAEGAGIDVSTVRRLEQGHPCVSLGSLAMVLLVLGEQGRMSQVLDARHDNLGVALSIKALPKRVRSSRRKKNQEAHEGKSAPNDDGAF